MKNFIRAILVATGLFAASSAMAATAISAGSSVDVTTTDCTLLGETVTVNLSSNVSGAYQCYEELSDIRIATCHKGGSRKGATATCTYTGCDVNGANCTVNDTSCSTTKPTTAETFTYADYTAYVASSTGGSVAKAQLGGSCATDGSQVSGLSYFN